MPVYGIQGTVRDPEYGEVICRKEIGAQNAREAEAFFRGWFVVEGNDVSHARFDVIADGMTFAEHMKRELLNASARLSLRYGVSVMGPTARTFHPGGDPRALMSLWLPNGWAVSLSSRLTPGFYIDTQMVTGKDNGRGDFRVDFGAGVMEYESRITIGEDHDAELGNVIEALAKLPGI